MKTGSDIKIVSVIILALIILGTDNSFSQARPAMPARLASTAPVRVISPGILPDNKVILRVYSKEATSVSVTGEWQSGQGAQETLARNDIPPTQAAPQSGVGRTAFFEESLVKDVMPFIDKTFRTLPGKDNRAIAGLSMGGAHTQTITNNNPGMFGYIGIFSMGLMNMGPQTGDAEATARERDDKIEALKKSGYRLYWIACGKDDFVYQSAVNLRNLLDKHEFRYIYRESTGGHTWANWRIYLSEFAPMLFK